MGFVDSQSTDTSTQHQLNALLVFGPTAVGKTAFLEHCWQYMQSRVQSPIDNMCGELEHPVKDGKVPMFEVVSADSRQVYRGLRISSAYPDEQLLGKLPHHLLGIKEATENYTVFDFVGDAQRVIREICARGNIPLVLGGAAFYLYNLWSGTPQTPVADSDVRAQIREEYAERGLAYMYARLKDIDVDYAKKISEHDTYRILRALEIVSQSGKKVSEYEENEKRDTGIKYAVYGFARERENLYRRINARVNEMYAHGLLEECHQLWEHGLEPQHSAYRTIGVQEFLDDEIVRDHWTKGGGLLTLLRWKRILSSHWRRSSGTHEDMRSVS